jgi:flavin-dependent dehydrogenase
MTEQRFDCGIIGGGLAGLCLAIQLADSGRRVILFEKERYPFHKVCGEYISMESYDFLIRIGLSLPDLDLPFITELKVSAPNGSSITRPLHPGGFGISRFTLDMLLAQLARKKGVIVMDGTRVEEVFAEQQDYLLKTETETFRLKIVSGAWGKRSVMDRKIGRMLPGASQGTRNYVAVKYHVKLDLPDHRIELHNFKGGYCGISKVDEDKCCFCYLTDSSLLKANGNNIQLMEQNILMQNPYLHKYFSEAIFLDRNPLTISQITFGKKTQVEKGMLLLGDAAGTVAPLCGNGMSMAMRASFLAAPLLNRYLDGLISASNLNDAYVKEWNESFSGRIRAGAFIQPLFGKKHLTNLSLGILRSWPWATDKLISMTHGKAF